MLKVGDTVKVISKTRYNGIEEKAEYIPIGEICKVIAVDHDGDGTAVELAYHGYEDSGYWYHESEVEKGHMEWVPE